MDDKIIATCCLCDDLLKAIHHQEVCQCRMNDAEIMTTALIASLCFRGNHESVRTILKQYDYIPHMLRKNRLSRRLHRIKERRYFRPVDHVSDCHPKLIPIDKETKF
jgi:hypothetical protein